MEFENKHIVKNEENRIMTLLYEQNYLEWLNNFSKKHQNFNNDDIFYCSQSISDNDREQLKKLGIFYEEINHYAKRNFIRPSDGNNNYSSFYKIRCGNIGYEIGIIVMQETNYFCKRIEIQNEEEFIDINDIVNNKKSVRALKIEERLNQIFESICLLHKNDVPFEWIKQMLYSTFNDAIALEQKEEFVRVMKM